MKGKCTPYKAYIYVLVDFVYIHQLMCNYHIKRAIFACIQSSGPSEISQYIFYLSPTSKCCSFPSYRTAVVHGLRGCTIQQIFKTWYFLEQSLAPATITLNSFGRWRFVHFISLFSLLIRRRRISSLGIGKGLRVSF